MEKSFAFSRIDQARQRRWFARMLWRAFPGASQRQVALRAAPVLGLSARQVENLLSGDHDPKLPQVLAVMAVLGAECINELIEGR